jgi:protease I
MGSTSPKLTGPVRILKQAGAQVDVLAQDKQTVRTYRRRPEGEYEPIDVPVDKKLADVSPEAYDAVLVPGAIAQCAKPGNRFSASLYPWLSLPGLCKT